MFEPIFSQRKKAAKASKIELPSPPEKGPKDSGIPAAFTSVVFGYLPLLVFPGFPITAFSPRSLENTSVESARKKCRVEANRLFCGRFSSNGQLRTCRPTLDNVPLSLENTSVESARKKCRVEANRLFCARFPSNEQPGICRQTPHILPRSLENTWTKCPENESDPANFRPIFY